MVKLILALILVLCVASPVLGQTDYISVSGDPYGSDCFLWDVAPGLVTYYVVHYAWVGATASQFWAPKPWCLGAVYLADAAVFPVTIGDSQTGVSIGYGSCLNGPIHVLTLNFFAQGTSPNCCCYFIYPHPQSETGDIEVVDCNDNLNSAYGWLGYINTDYLTCICTVAGRTAGEKPAGPYGCINDPIAVEQATWGKVKALYSD